MAIRNNHWYNLNEQHYYPLDDTASTLSDSGLALPSDIIADLRLRWPSDYGDYAYISAVTVTPNLVTLLIEAAHTLDNSPVASTLIAGISLPNAELIVGRTYALETFQQGVGGFIALGSGAKQSKPYTGKFSTPRQSLLTPRAARSMRRPPVQTIGVEGVANSLTGLVNLAAPPPLQLSKETRIINNVEYENVVVIRLIEQTQSIATGSTTTSVFQKFSGPCGKRVGSKSCGDPQPIETIGGVGPDSNGTLTLEFAGCAVVGRNVQDCGVILDCALGLSSSCNQAYLPNLTTGLLPNELPQNLIVPLPVPVSPGFEGLPCGANGTYPPGSPYCSSFAGSSAADFTPTAGSSWGFFTGESPPVSANCPVSTVCYGTPDVAAQALTNISLLNYLLAGTFRVVETVFKVLPGENGSAHEAGIIFNHGISESSTEVYTGYSVDFDDSRLKFFIFNGSELNPIVTVPIPELILGNWYKLTVYVSGGIYNCQVTTYAQLTDLDNSLSVSLPEYVFAYSTYSYGYDVGNIGLYARRTQAAFASLSVTWNT